MAAGKFDFNDLFTFELANNHQGSVPHGLRIIREIADIAKKAEVRGAIKLQFRELDSFIHPKHKENSDNKHIPRFLSTCLSETQFKQLVDETKKQGLISMVTPFDEPSVDTIERLGVEVIKIGSCSANDWPLLERVAETGKPVICSTGGLSVQEVDKVASFFQHRGTHFALMHCVGIYPTPSEKLQLNQIEAFRKRYPGIVIGFSTHEEPNNFDAVKVAYAKGARIFEKHVAIPTDEFKINAYSATPEQAGRWLDAYKEAVQMCGAENRPPADHLELESLRSLARGVYARRNIKTGVKLARADVYFAMPPEEGQLTSRDWKDYFVADQDYQAHGPIAEAVLKNHPSPQKYAIAHIVHALKGALNTAGIVVGDAPNVELSHHYGLERFGEWGAAFIDCINREYCKKIIIQLAGQKHPYHHHKKKEEAFQVLRGELVVELEGKEKTLCPGDVLVVPRGAWHSFRTNNGAIFEEVSTTHFNDDSFYQDPLINRMARENRKTKLINWGFRQFN